MKMKKTIAALVAISMIFGCIIGGTLAWLMDETTAVENTFTTSDIEISLEESENLDLKMIPGHTITKDPKVTVKAISEACWLFVKVEEDNLATGNGYNYFTYTINDNKIDDDADWVALGASYPGVYYREVADATTDQVFEVLAENKVVVDGRVTKDDMSAAKNEQPTLTFTAYAHQLYETNTPETGENGKFDPVEAWTNVSA